MAVSDIGLVGLAVMGQVRKIPITLPSENVPHIVLDWLELAESGAQHRREGFPYICVQPHVRED